MTLPRLDERDAVAFIVAEIADEAARAGKPLTDVERRMLFFDEGDLNAAESAGVLEAFESGYDEDTYERRIADLIRAARTSADSSKAQAWSAAIRRVAQSDGYLGVMIDQAGVAAEARLTRGDVLVVLGSLAVVVLFSVALTRFFGGSLSWEQGFYLWLAAMVAIAAFNASRWLLGAERVNSALYRAIDAVIGSRGKQDR